MKKKYQDFKNSLPDKIHIIPAGVVFAVLGGVLIYSLMQISTLEKNVGTLTAGLASTTDLLSQSTHKLANDITDLRNEAIGISETLTSAQQNIDAVKDKVGGVEATVGNISGTVGTLEKLAYIDPEILKKYSKVYFMNENYTPAHLIDIPEDYLYSLVNPEQFMAEAWPFLNGLLDLAKAEGVTLYVKSGYRSFGEQGSLKSLYSVVYGAGTANTFSADQGYSEHQLGTTVDLITTGMGGQLDGFENTEAYKWLLSNAHRFGFVLSYPEDNSHYVFEPWHWRFVGVDLATYFHDNNLRFYDTDQRAIDEYLANTFD